ncbi:hypothetical protein ACIP93_37455 [Streptomyces sp. NPDC088745]|uniref:hypothetical protein n=1 Tax=Streptomyces sp. NPDC088745 TaxID=3365884 RepID=UPI00380D6CDD
MTRRKFVTVLAAALTVVIAGTAYADTIDPVGIGDLWPSPETPKGVGKTMYETYEVNEWVWSLDTDYGATDVFDPLFHIVADLLMTLLVVVGAAVTGLMNWLFGLVQLPDIQEPLAAAIAGSGEAVVIGLFPAALAIAAFMAYSQGSGARDFAWVLLAAVVASTLFQFPRMWVDGVDGGRTIGAEIALSATSSGLGGAKGMEGVPFKLGHQPTYTGSARDNMLRTSTDAVWRTYTVTPWCMAEFGSLEACRRHARGVLDLGSDKEKRKTYLQDKVNENTVGEESARWREGHRPFRRAAVLLPSVVVSLLFAGLLITLLFASLKSLLSALFLLVVGAIFAAMWVIPGRPRRWGVAWADKLVGEVLESALATMTVGGVMILQVAITSRMGTLGWGPSAALSVVAAIAAFKYRATLQAIIGGSGGGGGGGLLGGGAGALLGTMLTRRMSRAGSAATRRRNPTPPPTGPTGPNSGGGGSGGGGGRGGRPPTRPTPAPPRPRSGNGPALPKTSGSTGGSGATTSRTAGAVSGSGGALALPGPATSGTTTTGTTTTGTALPRPSRSGRHAPPPAGPPTHQAKQPDPAGVALPGDLVAVPPAGIGGATRAPSRRTQPPPPPPSGHRRPPQRRVIPLPPARRELPPPPRRPLPPPQ